MRRTKSKLKWVLSLVRAGETGLILKLLRGKIYSSSISICLRRDLADPFEAPAAKVPITVSAARERDAAALFDAAIPGLCAEEMKDRATRWGLFQSGISGCYVALDSGGLPCYAQWLLISADNHRIRDFFGGTFPTLKLDEALVEGVFTAGSHRGQGIMSEAMSLIAERASGLGVRYLMAFVAEDNIASLKGFKRAGFVPYMLWRTDWRLLRPRVKFVPLPNGATCALGDNLVSRTM